MKIVFFARRAWPAIGGTEILLRTLANELSRRHEVRILAQRIDDEPTTRLSDTVAPPPAFAPFLDGAVPVEPYRLGPARRALLSPLLVQTLPLVARYAYGRMRIGLAEYFAACAAPAFAAQIREADVVHMWGGELLAPAAVRAARRLGAAAVVTPFAHREQWGFDPASARTYRSADAVLGLLDADASLYRELGADPGTVAVCGACSPGVAAGGGPALRARHGITGPLVLFLGARREYKGFRLLLDAAPTVAQSHPHLTVAVVGPGDPLPAARPGVRVLDVGHVDEPERAAWLDAADVLCLPSAGEILPITILEAWSVGTPVLTSDLRALRELVEGSGGGRVCPREVPALAAALAAMLDDPEASRRMGAAGQARWRRDYTPEAVAACHESVYAAAIERAGGGPRPADRSRLRQ